MTELHGRQILSRLAPVLYYRSMLYTLLVEKLAAVMESRDDPGETLDLEAFQGRVRRLMALAAQHHARPVFVLQALHARSGAAFESLPLDRQTITREFARALAAEQGRSWAERLCLSRLYRTEVFVEGVRRVGAGAGIQVIDPRPALTAREGGPPLFCDEVHLTDAGNRRLAETVAGALRLPAP